MKIRKLIEKLQALPEDKKDDDAIIWIEDGDRYPVHSVDDTIDGVVELNAYINEGIASKSYFGLDEQPSPLPANAAIYDTSVYNPSVKPTSERPDEDDYEAGVSNEFPSSENRIIAGVDFDDVFNLLTEAMKPILKDYRDKLAKKDDNSSRH